MSRARKGYVWRKCGTCDGAGSTSEWDSLYTTTRVQCHACDGDGGYEVSVEADARSALGAWRSDPAPVALDDSEWLALGGLLS